MKFHLPFGLGVSGASSLCISKSEYQELMSYARDRKIKLEGFKRFSGDISLIKEFVDDIVLISRDFPRILSDRRSLVVILDDYSPEDDFATTDRHLISINAKIFNNRGYLSSEYKMLSDAGKFVRGTNYRSVARHELGHVVANIYGIKPMDIAETIMPGVGKAEIIKYVKSQLSLYAADYEDGREIISECFSAYYSGIANPFITGYIDECKNIAKEGLYDKK